MAATLEVLSARLVRVPSQPKAQIVRLGGEKQLASTRSRAASLPGLDLAACARAQDCRSTAFYYGFGEILATRTATALQISPEFGEFPPERVFRLSRCFEYFLLFILLHQGGATFYRFTRIGIPPPTGFLRLSWCFEYFLLFILLRQGGAF